MIKDKEVAPEPQEHKCVAVDKPPYQCLTCGEMPKGIRTESVQVVENSKEQPSDTQNDISEILERYLPTGEEIFPELKDELGHELEALIAQREQAAELRGRIDEHSAIDYAEDNGWTINRQQRVIELMEELATLEQATKPEKGGLER